VDSEYFSQTDYQTTTCLPTTNMIKTPGAAGGNGVVRSSSAEIYMGRSGEETQRQMGGHSILCAL